MKSIFSFLFILSVVVFFPSTVHACMGFGCKTDLAILGEVVSIENNVATVKPFHIFPNSTLRNQDNIKIENTNNELKNGKKYALALSKKNDLYIPVWEILEIEGDSFDNAKLLRIKTGDDATLQWWINTNGNNPEISYYAINDNLFIRIGGDESPFYRDIQVYPEKLPMGQLILMLIGSFVLGSASAYFLVRRKKKEL